MGIARYSWVFVAGATLSSYAVEPVNFNRDIRPLLADRCFHCHGPDEEERKGHLRLDVSEGEEGAYRDHKGSVAIVPGSARKSALWHRIISDDPDEVMPPSDSPKKPLSEEEKALVKAWIDQGAAYEAFWAFKKPVKTPVKAKIRDREWKQGLIDPYVYADLTGRKMKPSPRADKRTLIRRVTFDLTGYPPTLDEVRAFVADESPDAYDKLIDRLLASESYGEHMARYWADLIRMADTNGMHKDCYRNFVGFRNWMIRSFNDNLPYSDFVRYQVGGDQAPNPTEDQLVASGFNRMHMIIDVGTALPEESKHKNVLDRVEETLVGFRDLYKDDARLAGGMLAEMKGKSAEEQADMAAWTMMAHSLMNLELAKVRR